MERERYIDQAIEFAHRMFNQESTLLDIGCKDGYAINEFNKKGYIAEGVDIFPQQGKYRVNMVMGDFDDLSINYEVFFDNIFINHMFEHAMDSMHLAREIHMITAEGGIIFVAVPYCQDRWAWDMAIDKTHYAIFNEYFLESIFLRAGFETIALKLYEGEPIRQPKHREVWYMGRKA